MREEIEKLAEAGKIRNKDVDVLVELGTEGFCKHRSWGTGRITAVDTVLCKLTIDFAGQPGHAVDLGFAAKILQPISKQHIDAQKVTSLSELQVMAATNHLGMIKLILESHGGKATADQIQAVLVPDVIEEDYKKWWEQARREMKKDGHFVLPTKKTAPIEYQAEEIPLPERLMKEFNAAKGLKARLSVGLEVIKVAGDMADAPATGGEAIGRLNDEIQSHVRTQPGLALEAVFVRDDLRTATSAPALEGEPDAALVWNQAEGLAEILSGMPVARQRRALDLYRNHSTQWQADLQDIINAVPARLCGEIATVLAEHGQLDALKDTLLRLINQHGAHAELLLWLAKDKTDSFTDILGPEAFRAMITALEREADKSANKLRDLIVEDPGLVDTLTQSADIEVVKDITRAIQLSPSFEGMDKRSVLGKLVKSHPAVQSFISGEQPARDKDNSLVVSWASLEQRKQEYEELIQKRIPANSKEIAVAREYGDLRENHEYKAAKEMQKVLMTRKGELELELDRARGTDFANADTSQVSIGTRVTVTNLTNNAREEYTLLGAWDGDPDNNILSYLTPLGQALLNHKIGQEVTFDMEGDNRRYRIESIAAHQPAASAATEAPETSLPEPAEESQPEPHTPEPGPAEENPVTDPDTPAAPTPGGEPASPTP